MRSTIEMRQTKVLPERAEFSVGGTGFEQEMAAVVGATAIEREWMAEAGLQPFRSDADILLAASQGELRQVRAGTGHQPRDILLNWNADRSDPSHEWHYSPPYLHHEAADALEDIANIWARRLDWPHRLSTTSMARNTTYQTRISERGKLAISPDIGLSTHVYGYAFDIDACGLNVVRENGEIIKANPRMNAEFEEVVEVGRIVLEDILGDLTAQGKINCVDEMPGTTNNCFHVAVKPLALS